MNEIPTNCILNKGITGCGGTELAINQKGHTIIAMPYVSLVKNKEHTDPANKKRRKHNVLGVYEGVTFDDIVSYAQSHDTVKIAVTYDSLPIVIKALQQVDIDVYNDVFLLVDEWHILFNCYSFRHAPIKTLLYEASRFRKVTYMSATPIEECYMLDELRAFPIQNIE